MKISPLIVIFAVGSAVLARADVEVTMASLRSIGPLPQDKAELHPEEKIDIKRRNPFAERKKVLANRPAEQVETEESRLRGFFEKQKVTGMMELGGKRTVTLGRLTLEAGKNVPQVIPGQTQILRVMRVEPNLLEIGWVEDGGYDTAVPRKITKKIDLHPKVTLLLASEEDSGENAHTYQMDDKGKLVPPAQSMFSNPSAIVDSMPPGSDTSIQGALSEAERAQMNAAENMAAQGNPPMAPDTVPDAAGNEAPPPPESTEDAVQPDPDAATSPPAPDSASKAGPPAK